MEKRKQNIEYGTMKTKPRIKGLGISTFNIQQHPRREPADSSTFGRSSPRGFTLLEILIAIAILAIILASVLPSLLNFRRSSLLNVETQEVVTLANRARMLSVSSKNDQQFGVHFEAGKVVLFQGATYTEGASTNEEHRFDQSLVVATTLSGGGADVLFGKVTGEASKIATTTLLINGTTSSTTVLILKTGVVTIN